MFVDIQQAVKTLNSGDPVAIPTETVYGLAARIDQETAIKKIFSLKQRPFFDPLIVHVGSISTAKDLTTEWSATAETLAQSFWPGPLTVVLPRAAHVNPLITSGLASVGMRMPRHAMALQILQQVGVPLAAPSANLFGRTSPTRAEHVAKEFGDTVMIVDGGACDVGLESTVLSVNDSGKQLAILREGVITRSQIEHVMTAAGIGFQWQESAPLHLSPGHTQHHYMPAVPLVVAEKEPDNWETFNRQVLQEFEGIPRVLEGVTLLRPATLEKWGRLELSKDPVHAAREFYQKLRDLAEQKPDAILFVKPAWLHGETWAALWNRLSKAASVILKN